MVQSRISDTRVIQYWDEGYLVAEQLRQQLSTAPTCCQRSGRLWDLAALYGKEAMWGASPVFADGTVVDAVRTLEEKAASLSGSRAGEH
ncbi:MAG TPA: hypothetical protein VEI52_24585 [Terriglobales bacterium]|nr:hypothetical protein [Terriglobales bacterium]